MNLETRLQKLTKSRISTKLSTKDKRAIVKNMNVLGESNDDDINGEDTSKMVPKIRTDGRQGKWHKIWERKGTESTTQVHYINGFNHQTPRQYAEMCETLLAPIGIKQTDKVVDCGCGAGAFLLQVQGLHNVN